MLANKKPLAGSWSSYDRLLGSIDEAGREMRYEATVGAGLPIIDTFHKLVETGDRVLRIEGCVSGTLMYVMSAVSSGKPFSQAVREAVELGYAEPDPRDDLTGTRCGAQGADPGAAARLSRARAGRAGSGAAIAEESARCGSSWTG